MSDLTYTAKGTFDNNRQANIDVCIPPEPQPNAYIIEKFNLSKATSQGTINAIFCYFSNHTDVPLRHSGFDYHMNFSINDLNDYTNSVPFDVSKDDALFIFFHNNEFDDRDVQLFFDQIETLYEEVKHHSNQSQPVLNTNNSLSVPRKVGLSLITKI